MQPLRERHEPAPVAPAPPVTRRAVLAGLALLGLGGLGFAAVLARPPAVPAVQPRVAWRFPAVGDVRGIATVPGIVFVGTAHGAVHALDAATGQQLWAETLLLLAARPTVVGSVLVASDTADTSAFEPATGRRVWQAPGRILAAGAPAVVVRSSWSRPPGGLGTSGGSGTVTALDPGTGTARWSRTWTGPPPTVVLSAGAAHLGSAERLVTLDVATGATWWERPLAPRADAAAAAALVASDSALYLLDGGSLDCLDARSGAPRWQAADESPTARLSVAGDVVCHAAGDRLAAWDADSGRARWTWADGDSGAHDLGPAAEAGDAVVLTADTTVPPATDGRRTSVIALDATTGELRWRLALPDPARSDARAGPVAAGDAVVVAAGGRVYSIV